MSYRHLKYFRFLNSLVDFNHGCLSTLNNRCDIFILDALFEENLKKISIEELQVDEKYFHDTHSFNGI